MSETPVTELELTARSYEVDAALELKPLTYMNWLQEIAWEAAAAGGVPPQWFLPRNIAPVFSVSRFEKEHPIRYGDRIIARTWFSLMEGPLAHREFELRRAKDSKVVLHGRTDIVLVDLGTRAPTPWGELVERFKPNGESFYKNFQPPAVTPAVDPVSFQVKRPVQPEEIDMARHVNNGFYLRWMTDAFSSFLQPALGAKTDEARLLSVHLKFGSPISLGQEVLISGKHAGTGEGISRWDFQIAPVSGSRRPASAELIFRWSPEWTGQLSV
ncbi:thioesterase [Stigmatella sp. ncwal1]|uniref:Thioesterase n=1 Tax=Stigmatella ashevillensis TaxID=2995309 RepID=A0ABT5D3R8_9BACT|nr:thioesterase family protein [Stigmatella ashevillena]MDC0708311.1 thioesterase [Stigmatella ashevillena]